MLSEFAALGTAVCWALTSIIFAEAGHKVGSSSVNLIRLIFALPMLCVVAWISRGSPLPLDATAGNWGWLAASGAMGFVFGDLCLFQAFVVLGPRRSSLLMATSPLIAALLSFLFLGEGLTWWAAIGMSVTIGGVSWAILERAPQPEHRNTPVTMSGIVLALGGSLGQAAGLVLAKHGMGDFNAIAATQIRVFSSMIAWVPLIFIMRKVPRFVAAMKNPRALWFIAAGAFLGPVLGVSLSLFSVQQGNTGVAASIMSITPILVIPASVMLYGEKVGAGGIIGTLLAVGGVALLFML